MSVNPTTEAAPITDTMPLPLMHGAFVVPRRAPLLAGLTGMNPRSSADWPRLTD